MVEGGVELKSYLQSQKKHILQMFSDFYFYLKKADLRTFRCLWEGCDGERQTKENFKSINTLCTQKANTTRVPGTRPWPPRHSFTPARRRVRSYALPRPSVFRGEGHPRGNQTALSPAAASPEPARPDGKAPARALAARRRLGRGAARRPRGPGGPFLPSHPSKFELQRNCAPPGHVASEAGSAPPGRLRPPRLRRQKELAGEERRALEVAAVFRRGLAEMLRSCAARLRELGALRGGARAPARNLRPALVSSGRAAVGAGAAGRPVVGNTPTRAYTLNG